MCGIFGYIGKESPLDQCLTGLKNLEYRGYDSAGIAGLIADQLFICKEAGRLSILHEKAKQLNPLLDVAIGHTRWATHGRPTQNNAHPHTDENQTLALVHNGIIENYDILRTMLQTHGLTFYSDTDTEVIAQLIAFHYKGNLVKAVQKSLKMLKGSLAISLVHKDYPGHIIATSRERPLSVGFDDNKTEFLVSSDPNAFLGRDLNVFFLKNDEVAVINTLDYQVYNSIRMKVKKTTEKFIGKNQMPDKNGYEHFMLKEIYEQPVTIQKAMLGNYSDDFGTAQFEGLSFTAKELSATRHIMLLACGTSWHASSIAAYMMEDKARIPTQAEIASELRFKNPIISDKTLVIAVSQSGETADTLGALREAKSKGAKILGVCNVKNSTLAREADSCIYLKAGPEFSVCSTKAFTSQLTILALFTLFMARLRHMDKSDGRLFLKELKQIPAKIEAVLKKAEEIKVLAHKYSKYDSFFFLGRHYMYPTCQEAALKLKEISYLNANSYPAGEMKHGPIALISENLPVIAFCANHLTYEKMLSNLMEVKSRGAPILAFASEGSRRIADIADDVIWLPPACDELATFPSSVAGQLLAYYIAKERGTEIDCPRNLAKSVTVE